MAVTFIGVRHHSPACARLVADTITSLRPAYVLVEGPADMNARMDELLLGHQLPIAVHTGYRDPERRHGSWTPLCDYSPEWTALTAGRAAGAELRFIDLPAWHPALAGVRNRYADAEARYDEVTRRLCHAFSVDNVDALWDHLFEIEPADGLAERLATYFDLVRGDTEPGADDAAREAYMARWIRAAAADAGERPVVVVTGGFHRPALIRLAGQGAASRPGSAGDGDASRPGSAGEGGASRAESAGHGDAEWPEVPRPPEDAVVGSYLVPYSFRRLDAFDGYQSGMPSPGYYQRLWESGPDEAARGLTEAVTARLRARRQPVSTADLIAARATADGIALMRGHPRPARVDVLDGLAAALVSEALETPLPWAARGPLPEGSHPVIVEMIAALSGDRTGRLHPATPLPPLVHAVLAVLGGPGEERLDLGEDAGRERSRLLHRLRVLGIPGVERISGPRPAGDAELTERWVLTESEDRLPALIEAGGYGVDPQEAAAAALAERITGADLDQLADVLFDAALCGIGELAGRVLDDVARAVGAAADLGALGRTLTVALAMWRHDGLFHTSGSTTLGTVVEAATRRALWVAEGIRGGPAPADLPRIHAMAAVRDAIRHAGPALGLDPQLALGVADRLATCQEAPPDLRGASLGLSWSLRDTTAADPAKTAHSTDSGDAAKAVHAAGAGDPAGAARGGVAGDPVRAVRGAFVPATAGDWLAGLFALAREEVLHADGMLELLDELVGGMSDDDFLVALPALRQAFGFFPPRERHLIATRLVARRAGGASAWELMRLEAAPELVAAGMALDERVETALRREGLITS
ncbi:unnamed protein product [[Actinomadura] parvosata subsp. kistnae]|uniref:Uncharacterized protein n=1 Tax=[Actinomadura] parvosata subsp. kistnae TaxID=1909395 RepID=A0A1V0AH90_9ACTN|nr:DUF5682 family protein [Nonomuraea sp. ATCC 55076]AQZ69553.1 hypothetical protein BKM31_56020 [Nonomuraea sp. ATCC 55076]SPL91769.1 unnamed protein product [Actinomadura parvosata subsp. kistnae]